MSEVDSPEQDSIWARFFGSMHSIALCHFVSGACKRPERRVLSFEVLWNWQSLGRTNSKYVGNFKPCRECSGEPLVVSFILQVHLFLTSWRFLPSQLICHRLSRKEVLKPLSNLPTVVPTPLFLRERRFLREPQGQSRSLQKMARSSRLRRLSPTPLAKSLLASSILLHRTARLPYYGLTLSLSPKTDCWPCWPLLAINDAVNCVFFCRDLGPVVSGARIVRILGSLSGVLKPQKRIANCGHLGSTASYRQPEFLGPSNLVSCHCGLPGLSKVIPRSLFSPGCQ